MKNIFAGFLLVVLSVGCTKNNDAVLIDEATVTILHSTCVKTIIKINLPFNTKIGVPWSNNSIANPTLHQHVIQAGDMKNVPVTGLEVAKQYKVRIYKKVTGPQVICYRLDEVNEPGVVFDLEFLP